MKEKKSHFSTTFQISHGLHAELKLMCHLTNKSMGEFIRIAIMEKVNQMKLNKEG